MSADFLYTGGLSGEEKTKPRVWLLTAAVLLVGLALETAFFPRLGGISALGGFPFFGAAPDFVLMTVVAFAFFRGGHAGGIAGIVGGFLLDAATGTALPVSVFVYFLVGYFAGEMNRTLPVRSFRAFAVTAATVLPVRVALTLVRTIFAVRGAFRPLPVLLTSLLPEAFWTAVAAAALFPLIRWVTGKNRQENP